MNRSAELQVGVARRAGMADLESGAPIPRFMVPMHAKKASRLSINLVAADVSPLILNWRNLSRLTSAATSLNQFMVPMHAKKRKEAFNEPENACLDYEGLTRFRFMVPMHAKKTKGGSPCTVR